MIKLFRKTVRNFMKWAMAANEPTECVPDNYQSNQTKVMSGSGLSDRNNGMNFTVFNATGGKVIQFATYDAIRDRGTSSLYVVTDREDLGEELAQIITRESLTR